jgi:NAD(P)-dependent dehydrogenase (short-subunit alcohol dehydrogenase family)
MSQTVVVTGASAGVGRAAAVAFAARGDRVGLLARGSAGLAGALAEVERAGGTGLAVETDVADPEAVEQAAATVEAQLGPIDVWVNNAMATVFAPFHEITPDEYRRSTEVTYLGTVHGTMAALRRMRGRGAGTIVQVGSALAYRGIPLQGAYCGAKHAIRGFTDALRTELMHSESGVRVTTVHLPAVNSTQFGLVRVRTPRRPRPVAPVFQPEVAARAIVWASEHPERREHWVGASTVLTILGSRLAPGAIGDRYLARTGFDSQQTSDPVDEHRRTTDYLFEPVRGDHGAHGPFAGESRPRSTQVWLAEHRGALAVGVAAAAGALGAAGAALARR